MRGKGIAYDTGFINAGVSTREHFVPDVVRREMRVIRDDLHCTAVRITGGDPDRLEIAARHAADAGLEVWYSPFTCGLTPDELLVLIADCAERAERLRREGADVVLVTGSEMSLFNVGFLPGETLEERLGLMAAPERLREALPLVPGRVNDFLGKAVAVVRERFGGKVSYASLPFEGVDWTPFDIIASDAGYRAPEIAHRFRDDIRAFVAQGKPAAVTEFGCATFRGAADLGGRGASIVEWGEDGRAVRVNGDYVRDEREQVAYLREVLDVFEAEGVDTVFWTAFASYHLPHRDEARGDLDMASYGVVKVLEGRLGEAYPDMPWEPKAVFEVLADRYRGGSS
ncbi:hypothetical protein EDD27_7852 [Nonomuraea polychroma]|uniref:Abortive infection protein n=1 Tax=Nonomuraea polychroma TaxID=46176 RepID=A0A438MHY7_9ACTN|nr:hypothetical protein EDD27_7852 [Nonomuraea polychroma]